MRLAKLTTYKFFALPIVACFVQHAVFSQEISPYSRVGLGDVIPQSNIISRGMGGVAAGISDYQSINFVNPASYARLRATVFELGLESDTRTLKSTNPDSRFSATNGTISYLQLGIPIKMKKANKKDIYWGMNMGLRPVTRISYKILKTERLPGIDSIGTLYEGNGGISQAYFGTAFSIKGFSLGANAGYMFGNKDYSTRITFLNDTVQYAQSNSETKTNLGGLFISGGMQYEIKIGNHRNKNHNFLRFGAYGNLKQTLSASKDDITESFHLDASGNKVRIDSVSEKNLKGDVIYPASLGAGFTYQTANWMFGADYETTKWEQYRFYDSTDHVQNSWKIRVGTEYFPLKDNTPVKKYFSFVRYRFGMYYGSDYVLTPNSLPEFGFSFGAGFPLKLRKSYYETQTSMLNTGIEFGSRGNKKSNLRENTLRISIGLSLSDLWFARAKYQ